MNSEQPFPLIEAETKKLCMLDIETLDTTSTAKILSLGAVDVYGTDSWYIEFNHFQYNRTTSFDTEKWWESQSIKMPKGSIDLKEGLCEFADWYASHGFTEVWCKGSDFDFVILSDAYKKETAGSPPWKYNEVRDLRTLIKLFPFIKSPAPYTNHNALVDSICQAQHLKKLLYYVNAISKEGF